MKWKRAMTAAALMAVTASAQAMAEGDAEAQAKEIYAGRCTPCHGVKGAGDGAASKGLTPPPRNFGDAAWQQSVTDEHIEKIIKYGGVAVGKSPAMPANPDLNGKPQVVIELREIVREFKQ